MGSKHKLFKMQSSLESKRMNISKLRLGRSPWVLCLVGIPFVLGACSSYAPHEPAPTTAVVALPRYKIEPLDTLNIVVWRNPELSSSLTVRPDGLISTPLVDDVQAAGKTPAELSRAIEKALAKYIRDPVVTIVVSGFQGGYADQVRVVGEAVKPGSMPYRPNMTLLDALAQAGGMTEIANGNAAVLIRAAGNASPGGAPGVAPGMAPGVAPSGAPKEKRYSVRLKDLLKRGDFSANVPVLPGDVIIVPQSLF
jgi:polysaccharide biosynthesis/export protein